MVQPDVVGQGMNESQAHWEKIYRRRDPQAVSWYEPAPEVSLELIDGLGLPREAAILDVGGGASSLAGELLRAGYTDVTVADISTRAMAQAQSHLGDVARRIAWVEADVCTHTFARRYDVWHDRAVFHFMITPADRQGYLDVLRATLRHGGHAIFATFGPYGPEQCSGLPTNRYSVADLSRLLGTGFEPISSHLHEHETPTGATQQFMYLLARRHAEP
jgi:SAM-dependent methyltransferase